MTYINQYDTSHWPPSPVIEIVVNHPVEKSPPPIMLKSRVDSGADCTVIPLEVIEALDLPFKGRKVVKDFSGNPHEVALYSARISIPTLKDRLVRVIGIEWPVALAGRDILNYYKVTLDGPNKKIEIG